MDTFITIVVSLAAGMVLGGVLGYLLATHIHSIAQAAADRISHIGMVQGATLEPLKPLSPLDPPTAK